MRRLDDMGAQIARITERAEQLDEKLKRLGNGGGPEVRAPHEA